jgi:hypothetical protein
MVVIIISVRDTEGLGNLRNASSHAGHIVGGILGPEDETASDTTDTAEASQGRGAESTLPLAADVVGLVCHEGGDVGVGTSNAEEHAEVSNRRVGVEAHNGEADHANKAVDVDDGGPHLVAVTEPGDAVHEDTGKDIRRCHQTLGCSHAEAEVIAEDDGKEDCSRLALLNF